MFCHVLVLRIQYGLSCKCLNFWLFLKFFLLVFSITCCIFSKEIIQNISFYFKCLDESDTTDRIGINHAMKPEKSSFFDKSIILGRLNLELKKVFKCSGIYIIFGRKAHFSVFLSKLRNQINISKSIL